jgi:hypothetical protein
MQNLIEFELKNEADGTRHVVSEALVVTVLPDGESTLFHRNAIKKNTATGETTHHRALVAELNGVRMYLIGSHIILTTQDLYL